MTIGTLAHRILEGWNFGLPVDRLADRIDVVCREGIPQALAEKAESITAELHAMFQCFAASSPYADLCRATILGREVPFAMSWAGGLQVMEGTIDVVYRLNGQVWVADYKTDRVEAEALLDRTAEYEIQARVYGEALSRCLSLDGVKCQLLFLRNCTAVQITG